MLLIKITYQALAFIINVSDDVECDFRINKCLFWLAPVQMQIEWRT